MGELVHFRSSLFSFSSGQQSIEKEKEERAPAPRH